MVARARMQYRISGLARGCAVRRSLFVHPVAKLSIVFVVLICTSVWAHDSRPSQLEVTQLSAEKFDIVWKTPTINNRVLALHVVYPRHCNSPSKYRVYRAAGSIVERSHLVCPGKGLQTGAILIDGLDTTISDVFLRIHSIDGSSVSTMLSAGNSSYEIQSQPTNFAYFRLGVTHILDGVDHQLFLVGLLLLVGGIRSTFLTLTWFTAAHSITLSMVALGVMPARMSITEPLIALSLMFLASEVLHRLKCELRTPNSRAYVLAFSFGLMHGMGFAGALLDVGLPNHEAAHPLLSFNAGVEAGQILFVAAAVCVYALLARLSSHVRVHAPSILSYAVGTAGAFLLIQQSLPHG